MMYVSKKKADLNEVEGIYGNDEDFQIDVKSPNKAHNEKDGKEEAPAASLTELYQYATPFDVFLMTIGTICSSLCGFCQPAFCLLFGFALDDLNGGNITDAINKLVVYLVILGIGNFIVATVSTACWGLTGERQSQEFREAYIKSVLAQEIGWFDSVGANQLATKLADMTGQLRDGMTFKTADFIQYLSQVIGAIIVGIALDPYVALIMFACTPLIGGIATVWVGSIASATKGSSQQYAAAGGLATESLTNIRTVTALNAQPDVINKFRKYLLDAMTIGIQKGFKVGASTGAMWFIVLCTYAVTLWYGSKQIADTILYGYTNYPDKQTGGQVYAAFFACLMGAFGLGQIAPPLAAYTSARVAAKSLLNVIHRIPLIDGLSDEGDKPSHRPNGEVVLKDIVFAYPSRPEINVCKGYNLTINAGQSCALVGASGSGKSTVINLLLRFYDPSAGSVSLDGTDIRKLNTRWLRAQIGYVGQEPVLFSGTIADNIAYGLDVTFAPELAHIEDPNASPEVVAKAKDTLRNRVIEAAIQANAHDFITSLPHGYDTDVGSSGSSMSGGQKQRIAIARALIKKPAVLLLDEATSALDATSERIVQESIDKLQASRSQTTIIIAHRLSTIRTADKIAVVNQGVIAEEGTHEDLMGKNGLYADLVKLQIESQEDTPAAISTSPSKMNLEVVNALENEEEMKNDDELTPRRSTVVDMAIKVARTLTNASIVKPDDEMIKKDKLEKQKISKKIWAMIFQHKLWFAVSIVGSVMVGAMFPLWGFILGKSLGVLFQVNEKELRINAAKQAGYFVGLAADAGIGAVLQKWAIAQVGERIVMKLRSDQFQAIIRREISFFDYKENAVGDITTRLSDDARSMTKATGEATAQQIQAIGCLIVGLIIGFIFCWKIGLVVLGAMIPMVISGAVKMAAYSGQLDDVLFKGQKDANTEESVIATAFTQMRTVSAFSVQYRVAKIYNELTRSKLARYSKKATIVGIAKGLSEFVTNAVFAVLFYYAGVLLSQTEFTFEEIMISILTLMFSSFGLGQALADLGDAKEAFSAAKRIFTVIEEGESSSIDGLSTAGIKPLQHAQGRIVLKDVNFCYPTRKEAKVCRDYNLTIEPGEMVALVGPSGSGKSTIMNLLLRFYDPLSGQVFLDGTDVKELNVRWLRSQIGYVGQEPVLFKGTIAENIAKGRANFGDQQVMAMEEVLEKYSQELQANHPNICCSKNTKAQHINLSNVEDMEYGRTSIAVNGVEEDIIEAAKASNAHAFISSFSHQYHTDVGESSMMVSGGQKQRIAIARALIKKPAVLLLDEATSALDAASERMVQESIDALQQNKMQTTIVIAHRLTTIKNADKIAVIDKGQVVEIGKHDELLAQNGLYAELWYKQTGQRIELTHMSIHVH